MTKNKIQNNGKAFWVGFMLIANAIPAIAQETVEIQYTKDGISRTIEVDRDIEGLSLSDNELTSLTLPKGLTNLEVLDLYGNELTSLTLPEGLKNLWALNLSYNQLTSLRLAEDTAERFAGIDAERALAYNLTVHCSNVPLRKVILPKRLDGKVSFRGMEDDVYDNLEFLFLEDLWSPKITRAGDALEITWAVGVLQTSAGIEGPWKDVRASSPLRIFPRPSLPTEFFRVRAE